MSEPAILRVLQRHAVFRVSPGGLRPQEMPLWVRLALFSQGPRFGLIADEELECPGYSRLQLSLAPLSGGHETATLASISPATFHLRAKLPITITHAGLLHPDGSMIAHVRLLEPCDLSDAVQLEFGAGQLRLTFPHQPRVFRR